jgi:hypothetical protein
LKPFPQIGDFIVQHSYRVDPIDHAKLRLLLAQIRAHADDLGVAQMEVWQDDDDPWRIVELHGYDSWSHYQRLSQKELPAELDEVYRALDRLVEGGLRAIETRTLTPWRGLAEPDGNP